MDSIISTFHIDWKIIIAQAVNFAIVLAVLYFFALKPLNKLMAERSLKIGKGIEDAKSNAEMMTRTTKEYEDSMIKARGEAQAIFQKGKKDAEAKKNEMMESAKTEVASMISSGKKSLEAEKTKMVEEARREIVELAMEATKKLLASDVKEIENVK
ncbi:MAG: F0F1 ATP synthase subunit B [Candidatus Taylorbacteria bacterium]